MLNLLWILPKAFIILAAYYAKACNSSARAHILNIVLRQL